MRRLLERLVARFTSAADGAGRCLSFVAVLMGLVPTLLISTLAAPSVAQAQQAGWCTYTQSGQGPPACYGSPDGACLNQFQQQPQLGQTFEGATISGPRTADCHWTPN
jgi:hypothetical protein